MMTYLYNFRLRHYFHGELGRHFKYFRVMAQRSNQCHYCALEFRIAQGISE
jgi:hypothetical protein